jgi:hypothetical protein
MPLDEAGYSLNVAGIYQDQVTRAWAMQTCRQATQMAGEESLQKAWYDVHSLSDHRILMDAVRAALMADVIVVSVYAADELPLDLYVWVTAWLPRRPSRVGALTALIGVAEKIDSQFMSTHGYLKALAPRPNWILSRRHSSGRPHCHCFHEGDGHHCAGGSFLTPGAISLIAKVQA